MPNTPATPKRPKRPLAGNVSSKRSTRPHAPSRNPAHEFHPPIRRTDGLQSRTERGAFVETWWAKRWIHVLENYGLGTRLQRGRSYARSGQVLSLTIEAGRVRAKVQGSRPKPYVVSIEMKQLSEEEWTRALDAIGEQAIFTAQLLDGTMPQEIESAFEQAQVELFPSHVRDVLTECNCPDMANPCKHIAAVYYLLGEYFDQDPFLIFTLRGQTRDQIMEGLRHRRAIATGPETSTQELVALPRSTSIHDLVDSFWGEELRWSVAPIQPPTRPMPLMRHLGPAPADTQAYFESLYEAITQTALKIIRDGEDDLDSL